MAQPADQIPSGTMSASYGPHPTQASVVVVCAHGRGSTGGSIIASLHQVTTRVDVAWLAPTAPASSWFPNPFMAPLAENAHGLAESISRFTLLLDRLESDNIGPERVCLFGFSQGACVLAELARARPRRYGALAILSGALTGPPDSIWPVPVGLEDMPVLVGGGDSDGFIPGRRLHDTAGLFHSAGSKVDYRLYDDMGHEINADERSALCALIDTVADSASEAAE